MNRSFANKMSVRRPQRRLLAAGARIRGQWRYLVRSTCDPLTVVPTAPRRSATRCESASSELEN